MAYGEYADSGRSYGKCLYQLSRIGVPLHVVESVIFQGNGNIHYQNKPFATVKWNETDTPIFTFVNEDYSTYKQLKQPSCTILMGTSNDGATYEEAGCFTDLHGLAFKEAIMKYGKTYLTDIDGTPLREQVLVTTTMEDKLNRLKNKFCK